MRSRISAMKKRLASCSRKKVQGEYLLAQQNDIEHLSTANAPRLTMSVPCAERQLITMNQKNSNDALALFLQIMKDETTQFIDRVNMDEIQCAAEIILAAQQNHGRLHITGIGKPSHVANYAASLFSSTGTPTYFLHGTEATHGSCGQLSAGDVVICISNSGETPELKATAAAILNNGCSIIAVTGNPDSWLAHHAKAHLFAGVQQEGGPLNRAPRASIIAEIIVLQCLSVALQSNYNLDAKQYVKWHPGGALGHLREDER